MANDDTIARAEHVKQLQTKQTKLDYALARIAQLEKAANAAPDLTAQLTAAATRIEELEQAHATYRQEAERRSVLLTAGVTDPEDQALVLFRHGRLPEEGRPGLGEWLGEGAMVDRHTRHLFAPSPSPAASPESLQSSPSGEGSPQTLVGHLPRPGAPTTPTSPPPANNGVHPTPSLADPFSTTALRRRGYTGEDAKWRKENNAQIMASLRGRR